jgi:hypothetical protein
MIRPSDPLLSQLSSISQDLTPDQHPPGKETSKVAEIAKKVFIVLGVATTGLLITGAVTLATSSIPLAALISLIVGLVLTTVATGFAIYYVTRPSSPPKETEYVPLSSENAPDIVTITEGNELSPMQTIIPLGENPEAFAKALAQEAIEKFQTLSNRPSQEPINGHDVEDYAISLIESKNRIALSRLNKRLKEEVGETVAQTIMSDWDLIGHDVRNNCALLDDTRTEEIIDHAKKAQAHKENKEKYKQQLNLLKTKLGTGEMPARILIIQKNFPLLAELIENDGQRKKELDFLLKEAAVKQQLRKGPLFQPSVGEKDIFKRLNLPTEHIDPLKIPDTVSRKMAFILLEDSPFFEESEDEFIRDVRKNIKKHAIEERIEQMGKHNPSKRLTKAKARAKHIGDLIHLRDHIGSRMHKQRRQIVNELVSSIEETNNCNDEKLKELMKATLTSEVFKSSRILMDTFLKSDQTLIDEAIEGEDSFESYHDKLSVARKEYIATEKDLIPATLREGTKNKLPEVFKWYTKWINNIKKPFSQGFDDKNEALQTGVCFAMALRMMAYEISHPDDSTDSIAEQVQIEPQDRFFQALYSANSQSTISNNILSYVGLANQKKVDSFPKNDEDLFDKSKLIHHLTSELKDSDKWKDMNGVCSIGLSGGKVVNSKTITNGWGHAIYTRIDAQRGVFRLVDPNFGLLSFDNQDQLLECLGDLIESAYPDTFLVTTEAYELSS